MKKITYRLTAKLLTAAWLMFLITGPLSSEEKKIEIVEKVFFTGTHFIVLGSTGGTWIGNKTGSGAAYISGDGKVFSKLPLKAENVPFRTGTSGKGKILVAGDSIRTGSTITHNSVMFLSEDNGRTWKEVPGIYGKKLVNVPAFSSTYLIEHLEFQNGYFTAITTEGAIYISKNGISWKRSASLGHEPGGALVHDNRIIVWGDGNSISIGRGSRWKSVEIGNLTSVSSVFHENGKYIGYGDFDCCYGEISGAIRHYRFESTDLISWKLYRIESLPKVPHLIRNENRSFIGISGMNIMSGKSPDSLEITGTERESLIDICSGMGIYLIAGSRGLLLRSTDGKKWTQSDIK